MDTAGRGSNGLSSEGQGPGAWSSGLKQRAGALVVVAEMMEMLAVFVVVLSGARDEVPEVVEEAELMLDAGAVMVDSSASKEMGGTRMRELKSSPISCCNVTVSVTVTIISGIGWLFDLLEAENAEKGSPIVVVTTGTADLGKQPIPIKEKSRQKGTFGGQHCGSRKKVLVQFGEI